ncbi:hypothetical protein PM8797T_04290 [Gimesia maris DSM 8797]|nr:hypothetical protein PM8797T_04290 [Gimesia maris DSM 8797]
MIKNSRNQRPGRLEAGVLRAGVERNEQSIMPSNYLVTFKLEGEVLAGKKAGGRYISTETESQYLKSRPKLQIKLKANFELFHISKMGRNPGKPVTK